MNFYIKFYPALNGDSMLLKINDYVMLIDGGYVDTFKNYIKPDLIKLNLQFLSLNHLIVTHIDKDHISGIIRFLRDNNSSTIIKIDNIWHNSFKHLKHFNSDIKFKGKSVKEIKINHKLQEEQTEKIKDISAVQGSTLASILLKGSYNWNTEFDGKAISTNNRLTLNLTGEIKLRLLSPSKEKLSALNLDWKKELFNKGYSTSEDLEEFSEIAFEALILKQKEQRVLKKKNISSGSPNVDELARSSFFEDNASANGSSIAFIIEYENRKLLFLSDAHPSVIIESLKLHYKEENFPLYFDVIKVSHHGSQKNTSSELLTMITSEKFIFSTNGKIHNHPDRETISRIISQKTKYTKELFFTYPIGSIEEFKDDSLKQKYNYQITEMNGSEPIKIDL